MSFQIFDVCEICGAVAADGFDNDAVSPMCDECHDVEADDEYDGQPDEAQEWYDFDPDCQSIANPGIFPKFLRIAVSPLVATTQDGRGPPRRT